jgi:hypothetical protein
MAAVRIDRDAAGRVDRNSDSRTAYGLSHRVQDRLLPFD